MSHCSRCDLVDAWLAQRQEMAESFATQDGSKADRLGWLRAAEALAQIRRALPSPALTRAEEARNVT